MITKADGQWLQTHARHISGICSMWHKVGPRWLSAMKVRATVWTGLTWHRNARLSPRPTDSPRVNMWAAMTGGCNWVS